MLRLTTRSLRYLAAAVLSAALLPPSAAQAQGGQIELRLDAARVQSYTKTLSLGVSAPGNAAIAWYLTPNIAIDARMVGLSHARVELPDGSTRSTTSMQVAAYLPIHFGARGRSGLFVAPGFSYGKVSGGGGASDDAVTTWGAEAGFKKAVRNNVSLRFAATYEDGDRPETIGATGGVSVFFR